MTSGPDLHPVYKALHRAPTFAGVDQRFLGVEAVGAIIVFYVSVFVIGPWALLLMMLMVSVSHSVGIWVMRHDPQIIQIIWRARRLQTRYDPGKRAARWLEVR